ncbi:hypothetical protein CPAR01_10323 [Colletotrichum paranaense]|uniref:Uncharacterized protein n=2 Tax=Colletotrichum acutatum species complex TaxID=2707335 RepID=A0AAI9XF24_9PEZI|nr:uncharacterized protein CPAR01_10323 [Colletotrichum paranaense]KAK1446019.1 hypothetical protein CMEL01_10262 [Colletotrichum melonis]KAK1533615.1 hypothetical protein CPAR01_10323 [Colletotrichum paranaense]
MPRRCGDASLQAATWQQDPQVRELCHIGEHPSATLISFVEALRRIESMRTRRSLAKEDHVSQEA